MLLECDKVYHIYNHANGKENLFQNEDNYFYFLNRYAHFINPIAETFAYCLLPNHFHFLIRIRKTSEVWQLRSKRKTSEVLETSEVSLFISKQFSDFFNAYTKAFNKAFNRRGSLFNHRFKRKEVNDEDYYTKLIHYIHANPVHHGFVKSIEEWKFSSYHSVISGKPSLLNRAEVLNWFGGKEEFVKFHRQPVDRKMTKEME